MSQFTLDPTVGQALAAMMPGGKKPDPFPIGDVEARRAMVAAMFGGVDGLLPDPADQGVTSKEMHTKSADGADVRMSWAVKADGVKGGQAVLYLHGGGMIAGSIDMFGRAIGNMVAQTGVPFLAVAYRLAPEAPYPKNIEDCYAALQYLSQNASTLGIDPTRIAVMGHSAGGGLAASLAHYAKEKHFTPKIAKQILVYPMLDDRNLTPDPAIAPFALWNYNDNATGWTSLLGEGKPGSSSIPPTAAAARATVEQMKDLPEAYIDVGELDIFRDEDLEYARKLGQAGVPCEFHLFPNVPHGWEAVVPMQESAVAAQQFRGKAIVNVKARM